VDRYSEGERRLGAFLLPHVFEAGTINRLLWLNSMTAAEIPKGGARAIVDLHGTIHACDRTFPELLRQEWPAWEAPMLPRPLMLTFHTVSAGCRFVGKQISVEATF